MIISGSTIVLAGRFDRLSKDEAKRGLEALGAKVTASVSAKTDLVFAGARSGAKAGPAAVRGIPIHDEDALVAVLDGREPGTAPPSPPFTGVPRPVAGTSGRPEPHHRDRRRGSGAGAQAGRGQPAATVRGSQEKTPRAAGSAVTRNQEVAVSPNVSSRVRLGTPA
ncbi:BRCT domain-containing protein [Nonomuraea muscovyensis]|uniref:BRCT domain-containing protein n=1 Tax=Nonomuraea muscovyensis TaxID=1124761 RepID=A0A7X0C691_9ACTN|nr:hypothetical protein [Nonomuraea muscovyensis]